MEMGVVYAKENLSVAWSQGKTTLRKGAPWDADAQLVRERPDLFEDQPAKVAGRVGPPVVERATRAPGEVRRPRRRA
jgi:hypothetical protein